MLPLTNTIPKPLVKLSGKSLIEYQIEKLAKAGVAHIVINVMHHKEQIMQALGNGDKYKLKITYSIENVLLGTGGGIVKALPLFNGQKFIVTSADLYTDFDFAKFNQPANNVLQLAHIVLVPNPAFNKKGDFILNNGMVCNIAADKCLSENNLDNFQSLNSRCANRASRKFTSYFVPDAKTNTTSLTYANIGVYHPDFFANTPQEFCLGKFLKFNAASAKVSGEIYTNVWHNIGTIEQLQELEHLIPDIKE